MELLRKLKEVLAALVPLVVLVTICGFITPLPEDSYRDFLLGSLLVLPGLTLFLFGVDLGVVPVGEQMGGGVMRRRCLPLMLLTGFIVGFGVTFAEPNAEVLAYQASLVNEAVDSSVMLLMLSLGVGLCVALAFLRLVLHVSLRLLLLCCYTLIAILSLFSAPSFLMLAFDGGGAATGPLAVPFIMALGIGSARVRSDAKEVDNFGFVSLQAAGAILAVLLMGSLAPASSSSSVLTFSWESGHFASLLSLQLVEVAKSLLPLLSIILLFRLFLIPMRPIPFLRVLSGLLYSYGGLVLFLTGAKGGFMPVAFALGSSLAAESPVALLLVGFFLGAIVVLAEPSVQVLVTQVEEISRGRIPRRLMLSCLAIGVSVALVVTLLRGILGFSLVPLLLVVYLLSFIMLFRGPLLFGAIAFDSGGVSAGPVAATFILPFVIGAGKFSGLDFFGVLGCISVTPLLTIQVLGLIYQRKVRKGGRKG